VSCINKSIQLEKPIKDRLQLHLVFTRKTHKFQSSKCPSKLLSLSLLRLRFRMCTYFPFSDQLMILSHNYLNSCCPEKAFYQLSGWYSCFKRCCKFNFVANRWCNYRAHISISSAVNSLPWQLTYRPTCSTVERWNFRYNLGCRRLMISLVWRRSPWSASFDFPRCRRFLAGTRGPRPSSVVRETSSLYAESGPNTASREVPLGRDFMWAKNNPIINLAKFGYSRVIWRLMYAVWWTR